MKDNNHWMLVCIAVLACSTVCSAADEFPRPMIPYAPELYVCYKAEATPLIDGELNEEDWQRAPWSEYFVDIEGELAYEPRFSTRMKVLWDADGLYFGAFIEEPHVQASFTERDSYIYQLDNDFEIFIDPDGDTHNYYELEINALNTVWDLLLTRPYRDGGSALHSWDIKGLRTAVSVDGSLNDASDIDRDWTVEIAIPWQSLAEAAGTPCPPDPGDCWKLNFSRVQWFFDFADGKYFKVINSTTGEHYPENNWVWSSQGLVAMHYPERWGCLVFAEDSTEPTELLADLQRETARSMLYEIYYAQRDYCESHGNYAVSTDELDLSGMLYVPLQPADDILLQMVGNGLTYQLQAELSDGGVLKLDQTGRSWYLPDG